jgi:beta-lactamase regulating signal transducer with metallopeptidase domain
MIERTLVEYVANALWQIPLLAGGAWLLLTVMKAGPRVQYGVWLGVLAMAVLLPLHGMGENGAVRVEISAADARAMERLASVETSGTDGANAGATGDVEGEWSPLHLRRVTVSERVARWMAGLYMGSVLFALGRVVRAWHVARRLVEESSTLTLAGDQTELLEDYGRRMRIRLPEVRESVVISSPMVVGMATPVLLLPDGFARHSEEEMRAALLHELAHVKRHDTLVNAVCQVAALPVSWHPATQWVQGRIRRTREMVCDAMAAEEMQSEIGYARCLMTLARSMLNDRELESCGAGVGLFHNNVLEERMARLMETKTAMRVRTKVVRVMTGAVMMAGAVAMAAMFHVTPTMAKAKAGLFQTASVSGGKPMAPEPAAVPETPAAPEVPAVHDVPAAEAPALPALPAPPALAALPALPAMAPMPALPAMPAAPPPPDGSSGHARGQESRVYYGDGVTIVNGEVRELTPEEKARVDKEMARAAKEIAAATARLNSPEFKREMEEAKAAGEKARAMVDSPEFKKEMEEARAAASKANDYVNSPEFKKQIEEARTEAAQARDLVNSPEFKQQMEEAKQAQLNLKLELPQIQEEVRRATAEVNSPEFKKQMEDVKRQVEESMRSLNQNTSADPDHK